jgi:predicted enzyme related to lactoylglutathione lyase
VIGRVSFLTIDANDPTRLAAFWCEVLGTQVEETSDEGRFVFLAASNGYILSFQRVPELKSVKNRVHLDIRVEDLGMATDAVLGLGGTWDGNERALDDARWRTLGDPEGNEFDIYVSAGEPVRPEQG